MMTDLEFVLVGLSWLMFLYIGYVVGGLNE